MNTIKYEDTIPGEAVLPKDLKVDGIYYHGDQLVRIDGVRLIPKQGNHAEWCKVEYVRYFSPWCIPSISPPPIRRDYMGNTGDDEFHIPVPAPLPGVDKLVEMVQILESRQTINDVRLHAKLDTIIVLLERLIASTMAEPQP